LRCVRIDRPISAARCSQPIWNRVGDLARHGTGRNRSGPLGITHAYQTLIL
jgi:hypothetical protein